MIRLKGLLIVLFLLPFTTVYAQIYAPVTWEYEVVNTSDKEAELHFTAIIEAGWHIYSLTLSNDEGPIPTGFKFTPNPAYKTIGGVIEGKPKKAYDPNFMMDLTYFEKKARFTQKIERLAEKKFQVNGELVFMVCNDEMCLPPEYVEFDLDVNGANVKAKPNSTSQPASGSNVGAPVSSSAIDAPSQPIDLGLSQIYEPVKWTFRMVSETDSSAVLHFEARIDSGWHLYATTLVEAFGPQATLFTFEGVDSIYRLAKPMSFPEPTTLFDPNFELELPFYSDKVIFEQEIIKGSKTDFELKGNVLFMSCDDSKCTIPETLEFAFKLKGNPNYSTPDLQTESNTTERSYWGIFLIAFFSGFLALLTPCVFPMIPMTVSFFTKQSKTRAAGIRNAVIYGLSIIVLYVLLGVVVTAIFGASTLSELSTNPWFNLGFFVLIIIFAISFLGAFEITLPSSWINKADKQADRGGMIGIFFMAFTLALVSFSCTGPIVGSLIVEAATKGGIAPVIGMFGFSLAIALPFTLFAAFPGWLNSLPQSGGWLNSVKVFLGFLELALAFKFLSNADLVLQWHLLEREVFLAIWIAIFAGLSLYLFGKIRTPHDSEIKHIGVGRLMLALLSLSFTIYLIPGLWGAPLKLIAAFPPPLQYSESPQGVGFIGGGSGGTVAGLTHDEDMHVGPQGIMVFHDYEKGLAHARKVNKPLLVDFTGHACVNCRKMEQKVWSDPEIKRKLSEDVVLISLSVDERVELPESEKGTIELPGGRKRKLRYTGDKWAAMQETRYKINAQPYYVLLDLQEEKLVEAANYQDYGKIALFDDWIKRGVAKFRK